MRAWKQFGKEGKEKALIRKNCALTAATGAAAETSHRGKRERSSDHEKQQYPSYIGAEGGRM